MRKLTTEEFVCKAQRLHGVKFDYSQVTYRNNKSHVVIVCPTHGEFLQAPDKHLMGQGCPSCAANKKLDSSTILARFRAVHGGKYGYEKSSFKSTSEKVEITCRTHGSFWQTPECHFNGDGCPSCAPNKALTLESFVSAATIVHEGKYDYSLVNYVNTRSDVEIVCPEHGSFLQRPENHLSGNCCPTCATNEVSREFSMGREVFISRATAVHGGVYDYSDVVYTNAKAKVEIKCPTHGVFTQQAFSHLSGCGCPACRASGFDLTSPASLYVYSINTRHDSYVGFGITGNVSRRAKQHSRSFRRAGASGKLIARILFSVGHEALEAENEIKRRLPCVDTGIAGFRTEAVASKYLNKLLDIGSSSQ